MNQDILDTIADGIGDRMDIDTGSSHWAEGALAALQAAGYAVVPSRAIETLAVVYHAYLAAKDDLDVVVWGPLLIEAQRLTGVQLLNPLDIQTLVAAAYARRATVATDKTIKRVV